MKRFETILIFFFAIYPSGAWAQERSSPEPDDHVAHGAAARSRPRLTLHEALLRGSQQGPGVQASEAALPSAHQALEVSHPALTQAPMTQTQLGPRWSGGTALPEVIVSVVQPIQLFDQGAAQESVARAQVKAADQEVALARVEGAARAGLAWLELAYADALIALRSSSVEQAEVIERVAQARLSSGQADPAEFAFAQLELVHARSALLDAEGMHFTASTDLAYETGERRGTRLEVAIDDYEHISRVLDTPGPVPRTHPSLALAQAEHEMAKARVAYQKAQQSPQFSFGVQYQREGTGDQILTGVFNLPIPVNRSWRFQVAEQHLASEKAKAQVRMTESEYERKTELAHHELSHAMQRYELLSSRGAHAHEEAMRVLLVQYQEGAVDLARLSFARRTYLTAEEELLGARFDVHRASLELGRIRGTLGGQL